MTLSQIMYVISQNEDVSVAINIDPLKCLTKLLECILFQEVWFVSLFFLEIALEMCHDGNPLQLKSI